MSYHRRRIPKLKELENIYSNCKSDEEFIKTVIGKADTIEGNEESIKFINKIKDKINNSK